MDWGLVGRTAQTIWGVAGPLVGVWVGAYLAGRQQKREWLAANKKEEYREVVAAITKALSAYVQIYAIQTMISGDDERRVMAVDANFIEVMRSRLFIARQVKGLDVERRFLELKSDFRNTRVTELFISGTNKLIDDILTAASKDM